MSDTEQHCEGERLEAYAQLRRASGGVVLSVVRHVPQGVPKLPLERLLVVVLDRDGWEDVTLQPDIAGSMGVPGAALGHELIRHGYMRHAQSPITGPGLIFGWRRLAGEHYRIGSTLSETNPGPWWALPVIRLDNDLPTVRSIETDARETVYRDCEMRE